MHIFSTYHSSVIVIFISRNLFVTISYCGEMEAINVRLSWVTGTEG